MDGTVSAKYLLRQKKLAAVYFDFYGTIGMLSGQNHVTLNDLCRWAVAIRQMPCYWEAEIACIRLEDEKIFYA